MSYSATKQPLLADNTCREAASKRALVHIARWAIASAVISAALIRPAVSETLPILISDNDWKPWYFAGKNDGLSGFAKDVIRRCVRQSGYEPRFRHYPIERMRSMMKNGRMDASIFSFKPHRKSFLVYSKQPLFREFYVPFVRANSTIQIKKISDFDNLRLGHLNGLTYSREFFAYIQKRRNSKTLDVTTSSDGNLQKLVTGKIDVFVDTVSSVRWHAAGMGLADQIRSVPHVIRSADYFFTLSRKGGVIRDKTAFIGEFDACVRGLKKSDQYRRMAAKYGMTLADLEGR